MSDRQAPSTASGMERVGPRLRKLRHDRGMTLESVADKAGVTKGFLSLAERGKTRVSVPTLLRICDALDVRLGTLFEFPDADVVSRGAGAPLQMGGIDIHEYLLTPADEPHVQVMQTYLKPGGGSGGAYTLEADTVFAFVVRGQLDITVDGVPRHLDSGDSTTFSARLHHTWVNTGDTEAEVLWVIAPPLPREAMTSDPRTPATSR